MTFGNFFSLSNSRDYLHKNIYIFRVQLFYIVSAQTSVNDQCVNVMGFLFSRRFMPETGFKDGQHISSPEMKPNAAILCIGAIVCTGGWSQGNEVPLIHMLDQSGISTFHKTYRETRAHKHQCDKNMTHTIFGLMYLTCT